MKHIAFVLGIVGLAVAGASTAMPPTWAAVAEGCVGVLYAIDRALGGSPPFKL